MLKLEGRIDMGRRAEIIITPGRCIYVPTGGAIPNGADGLAMIEVCEQLGDEILVRKSVAFGESIMTRGEVLSRDQLFLKKEFDLPPEISVFWLQLELLR
jgi:molybdopterin molybdotransferase